MSSVSVPSPYSKRLLFLKKFDMYTLYRLPLFLGSVGLFLSALISVGAFAGGTLVENYVPQLTGSSYLLARCYKESQYHIDYKDIDGWFFKCKTLFLEPFVKGKPLKKYAHTYYPAKYCPSSSTVAIYKMRMNPTPYNVVQSCVSPWK